MDTDFKIKNRDVSISFLIFVTYTMFAYVGTTPVSDTVAFAVKGWVPVVALCFVLSAIFFFNFANLKHFPWFLAFNASSFFAMNEHLLADIVGFFYVCLLVLVAYRRPLAAVVALLAYLTFFSICSLAVSLPALIAYFEKSGLVYGYFSSNPVGFIMPPRATGLSRTFALCGILSALIMYTFDIPKFQKRILVAVCILAVLVVIAIPSRGVLLCLASVSFYMLWRERDRLKYILSTNKAFWSIILGICFCATLLSVSTRFSSIENLIAGSGRLVYWLKFLELVPRLIWAGGEFHDKKVLGQVVSNGLAYALLSGGIIGLISVCKHVLSILRHWVIVKRNSLTCIVYPILIFLFVRTFVENGWLSIGIDQMIWAVCIGILASENARETKCAVY